MESRQSILDRLRSLRKAPGSRPRPSYTPEAIFADIPTADRASLIEQFSRKLTALRGEVFTVASHEEAARKIAELARTSEWLRCGRQRVHLLDRLFESHQELAFLAPEMTIVEGSESLPHATVESMQCAFTVADSLIARTGSIVLQATTAGGRRLSVLPPVHCVVATADQLVPCLSPWLSASHQDQSWSYGTIITGPSRTADIERILVLGAHGPKRLIVIVIDEH
jgi:L-lactate dehydrogenase complex protein LldG